MALNKKRVGNLTNHPIKQFCVRGHNTFVTGRNKRGACKECLPILNNNYRQLQHIPNPKRVKTICANGHDLTLPGARNKFKQCTLCQRTTSNEWHKEHPNRMKGRKQHWRVRKVLNTNGTQFSMEDFDKAFKLQEGKCKICGKHQDELKQRLCVDHDHKTGLFRGLLCNGCNFGLGVYEKTNGGCEKYLKDFQRKLQHESK